MRLAGYLLFLFIPLVLFLYVRHPEPIAVSLPAGIALMLGHRFLARPYMERVRPGKCVWCNRSFAGLGEPARREVALEASGREALALYVCPEHEVPTRQLFGFLDRCRWVLRLGVFVPLLTLLAALAVAAIDRGAMPAATLESITALFKLVIGSTVNLVALGYLSARPAAQPATVFPTHNFYLMGVRNILWVFRIVGLWWIYQGVSHFL